MNCQPGRSITVKVDDYQPGKDSSYLRLEAKDVAGIGTLRSIALQTSGVSSPKLIRFVCNASVNIFIDWLAPWNHSVPRTVSAPLPAVQSNVHTSHSA